MNLINVCVSEYENNITPIYKVGGVNVQCSFHPQYHDWGAIEQDTEPPTAPRAPQHKWLPTAPGVYSQCVCALWMG